MDPNLTLIQTVADRSTAALADIDSDIQKLYAAAAQTQQAIDQITADRDTKAAALTDAQTQLGNLNSQVSNLTAALADANANTAAARALISSTLMDVCTGRLQPTVYADLHLAPLGKEGLTTWTDAGGTRADSNPNTTVKPHGTPSYTLPGDGTALLEFQPAAAYDNIFIFRALPSPTALSKAADFRKLMIPAKYKAGTRCIEIQREWNDGAGWRFNLAYQFNFASGKVHIFNYTEPDSNKKWVPTAVPLPDFSQMVTVQPEFDIDTVGHTTTHRGLWINNVWYPVNQTFKAANTGGTGRKYTVAIQLDTQSGATPPLAGVLIGATAARDL